MNIFQWRNAFLDKHSGLSPTERFVLLTVSLDMKTNGAGGYPSIRRVSEKTGFSSRSVCTALMKCVEKGWVIRYKNNKGKNWAGYTYYPSIPNGVERQTNGVERHDIMVLNDVQTNSVLTLNRTPEKDKFKIILENPESQSQNKKKSIKNESLKLMKEILKVHIN